MTDLALQHGLSFADLYDRDGLVRLDQAFVAHLAEADVGLHDRLMAARSDPDAIERQIEFEPPRRSRTPSRGFHRRAVRYRCRSSRVAGAPPRARPALLGQAALCSAPRGKRGEGSRRRGARRARPRPRARSADGAPPDEAITIAAWERRYAEHVANWLADEAANAEALDIGAALRRLGDFVRRGPPQAPSRRAVQGAASARHAASRSGRDGGAGRCDDAAAPRGRNGAAARALR